MKSNSHYQSRGTGLLSGLFVLALGASAIAGDVTYQYYRFAPNQLRYGGTTIQLSEFLFSLDGAPVSVAGVTVTSPGGNFPVGEAPPNLVDGRFVDGDYSKWLDFDTSPVIFDFGVATTIDNYNFITGNDSDDRDPVSWRIEGSTDTLSWDLLDVITDNPTPTARYTAAQGFDIPDSVLPIVTSYSANRGIVLNGESLELEWVVAGADTVDIQPAPGAVGASDFAEVTPPNDADTTYTVTGTNAAGSDSAGLTVRTVVGGSATFQYYRFSPTVLRDDAQGATQLSEFTFINDLGLLTPTTVTSPGGISPGGEGPENAADGDVNTKWLGQNRAPLVYDFGTPTEVDSYYYYTANDFAGRDPVQWTIEGSDDNLTWTLIENVNFNYPVTTTRFTDVSAGQDVPLPGASLAPVVSFVGDTASLVTGESLVLTWTSNGASTVSIDNGVGAVATTGNVTLAPTVDSTYTLTATSAGGGVSTAEFSVVIINPAITTINYPDFEAAGEELLLGSDGSIVNDFANIPEPGDFKRLRVNPAEVGVESSVYFAKRVDTSLGFDSNFDMQFAANDAFNGDGMMFVIQNHPQGTTHPGGFDGVPTNALNIYFDSYLNDPDPSSAMLKIFANGASLAAVNLAAIPELTLRGTDPFDLSDDTKLGTPYAVRVAYLPGDLDVYFDGVLVVDSLAVDLGALGAVDASGTGYTGFIGLTGGATENHDLTSWTFVEGPPAISTAELELLAFSMNQVTSEVSLTWASSEIQNYRITSSTDLSDWSNVVTDDIPGEPGLTETTRVFSHTPGVREFYRVEEK